MSGLHLYSARITLLDFFFTHDLSLLFLCIEFDITTILASIRKNSRRFFYVPKAFTSTPAKSSMQISYLHFSTTLGTFLDFSFIHFLFHTPLNNALFSVKNDAYSFSYLSPLFFGLFHAYMQNGYATRQLGSKESHWRDFASTITLDYQLFQRIVLELCFQDSVDVL